MSALSLTGARRAWSYLIAEPARVALDYAPQTLITSASVYLVAGFGAAHDILPRGVAYAMAIGFEWTLLRGWATAAKLRGSTPWEVWGLNVTALITVICYGILYILGLPSVGVIPDRPGPGWGIVLAVAKVVPLALMTFFAMMLHRAAGVQAAEGARTLDDRKREIDVAIYAAEQKALARARVRAAQTRTDDPHASPAQTPHAAAQSPAREMSKEELYAAVRAAYAADPHFSRADMARRSGWSEPMIRKVIKEITEA